MEIILQRFLSEIERCEPGFIERLAGHYALKSAPDSSFDVFLGEVDEAIDNLLALARAEAERN